MNRTLPILCLAILAVLLPGGRIACAAPVLAVGLGHSPVKVVSAWGGAGSEQIILESDGTVWDWGWNSFGQLGNGATNNTDLPEQVLGAGGVGSLTSVMAIMGGETHNLALKTDGTVWAWGRNLFGELGDGSSNWGTVTNDSLTPVKVSGLGSVVMLGGRGYHNLAVRADGTVWAWGDNTYGELGIGTATFGTNVPVQVIGVTNPVEISGGGFYSLALMPDGTVRAWGENAEGECGNGTTNDCWLPVPVTGLSNVVSISGGWRHALAVKSDGTAWTWGQNEAGELGNGMSQVNSSVPVQVLNLSNVVAVSGGDGHSLARLADGTIWKWGDNSYGTQGNGTSDSLAHPVPAQVPGLGNVVISAARDFHCICVKQDGTVWVWGDNRWGGCGDFSGNSVLTPRLMPGFAGNTNLEFNISLSWPAGGGLLQQNSNLATTNWITSAFPAVDDGTNNTVTLTAPPGNLFFRLRQ